MVTLTVYNTCTYYDCIKLIFISVTNDIMHVSRAEEGSFEWYGQVQQFFNKMVGKVDGSKSACVAHNRTCEAWSSWGVWEHAPQEIFEK